MMENMVYGRERLKDFVQKEAAQQVLHVESTSVLRGYYVDTSKTKFRRISTSFPVLFRCNFADRKFHVVSMYLFRRNFDGRKIRFVFTYFFCCNFDGRKIHVVSTYFFRCNFDGRNIHDVSTCFFRLNLDGRKIHFVCTYFS